MNHDNGPFRDEDFDHDPSGFNWPLVAVIVGAGLFWGGAYCLIRRWL